MSGDESRYNDLTNLFGIDWQIIEGLRLKGSFSFTLQNTSADVFKPAKHTDFATYTGDDFDRRGSYSASRGDVFDYDASLALSYSWQANKHVINANLGWRNAKTEPDERVFPLWRRAFRTNAWITSVSPRSTRRTALPRVMSTPPVWWVSSAT